MMHYVKLLSTRYPLRKSCNSRSTNFSLPPPHNHSFQHTRSGAIHSKVYGVWKNEQKFIAARWRRLKRRRKSIISVSRRREKESDRLLLSTISKFKKWHHQRLLRYDSFLWTTRSTILLNRGKRDAGWGGVSGWRDQLTNDSWTRKNKLRNGKETIFLHVSG